MGLIQLHCARLHSLYDITVFLSQAIFGGNGGTRTHHTIRYWNLNPARLPITPHSHNSFSDQPQD